MTQDVIRHPDGRVELTADPTDSPLYNHDLAPVPIAGRTWTLELRVTHPVLRFDLSGFVTTAVQGQLAKAPAGLATARTESGGTVVDVDLDKAAALLPDLVPAVRGLRTRVDAVSLGEQVRLVVAVSAA